MNLVDGYELVIRAAMEAARPDPELLVDVWAEEFMILPKSGPQPGPFRFDRSYPARRVHQVLSPSHPAKRVVAKVASQMFKALADDGINIQMISTSEIKISVVLDEKYLELAVRVLHRTFGLDQ